MIMFNLQFVGRNESDWETVWETHAPHVEAQCKSNQTKKNFKCKYFLNF